MSQRVSLPEVFSAREIARAAGVGEAEVRALIEAGAIRTIPTGGRRPLVAHAEAIVERQPQVPDMPRQFAHTSDDVRGSSNGSGAA